MVTSPSRFGSSLATLALTAASFLIVVGGLELVVRILDLWSEPRALILDDASDPGAIEPPAISWIPHPYLGWQLRPGRRGGFLRKNRREAVFGDSRPSKRVRENGIANRFGFLSSVKEYEELSAEDYVVGIFGGSVATGFASIGGEVQVQVILNGANSDRYSSVLDKYGDHARFIANTKNIGVAAAWNQGVVEAATRYVVLSGDALAELSAGVDLR